MRRKRIRLLAIVMCMSILIGSIDVPVSVVMASENEAVIETEIFQEAENVTEQLETATENVEAEVIEAEITEEDEMETSESEVVEEETTEKDESEAAGEKVTEVSEPETEAKIDTEDAENIVSEERDVPIPEVQRETVIESCEMNYDFAPQLIENIKAYDASSDVPLFGGFTGNRASMPTTGDVKTLVFVVDFADKNFSEEWTANVENYFFGEENKESAYYPYESLAAYYDRSSYGKLNLDGEFFYYHDTNNRSVYDGNMDTLVYTLIDEYCNSIKTNCEGTEEEKEAYLNEYLKQFDSNSDGVLDGVYINYAGETNGWAEQWWSYVGYYNGFAIGDYTFGSTCFVDSATNEAAVTLIHETGHMLGLADYYGFYGLVNTIATADMMSSNELDHNGFSKMLLGWIEPEDITIIKDSGYLENIRLNPYASSGEIVLIVPDYEESKGLYTEFYMVEYYDAVQNDWANEMETHSGLRIYHINAELNEMGTGFVASNMDSAFLAENPSTLLIQAVHRDMGDGLEYYSHGVDFSQNCLYVDGDELTPYTLPSSYLYETNTYIGEIGYSGIVVDNISLQDGYVSFNAGFESEKQQPELRYEVTETADGEYAGVFSEKIKFSTEIRLSNGLRMITTGELLDAAGNKYGDLEIYEDNSDMGASYCRIRLELVDKTKVVEPGQYTIVIPEGTITTSYGVVNEEMRLPYNNGMANLISGSIDEMIVVDSFYEPDYDTVLDERGNGYIVRVENYWDDAANKKYGTFHWGRMENYELVSDKKIEILKEEEIYGNWYSIALVELENTKYGWVFKDIDKDEYVLCALDSEGKVLQKRIIENKHIGICGVLDEQFWIGDYSEDIIYRYDFLDETKDSLLENVYEFDYGSWIRHYDTCKRLNEDSIAFGFYNEKKQSWVVLDENYNIRIATEPEHYKILDVIYSDEKYYALVSTNISGESYENQEYAVWVYDSEYLLEKECELEYPANTLVKIDGVFFVMWATEALTGTMSLEPQCIYDSNFSLIGVIGDHVKHWFVQDKILYTLSSEQGDTWKIYRGKYDLSNLPVCLVTFDSMGGTEVYNQGIKTNTTVEKPTDPTRNGYIFLGWYLKDELYDFTTPVTTDITLEAKWQNASGTIGDNNGISWNYDVDTKTLTVTGNDSITDEYSEGSLSTAVSEIRSEIENVVAQDLVLTGDAGHMFSGFASVTSIEFNNFNTANVTDMESMFDGCSSLSSLDVSDFDTSNVTDMSFMFSRCDALESIDVSMFNTSNVTTMEAMFAWNENLENVNMTGFDTAKVTDMSYMFYGSDLINILDLSSFTILTETDTGSFFPTYIKLIYTPKTIAEGKEISIGGVVGPICDRQMNSVTSITPDLCNTTLARKYTISYELGGGIQNENNPTAYLYNSPDILLYEPTKEGYEFDGWYIYDSNYENATKVTSIPQGTVDHVTLYARWIPAGRIKYSIAFDGNGSTSGRMETLENCYSNVNYSLPENAFQKTGYEFIGWNTCADGSGTAYVDMDVVTNLTNVKNTTVTLYAQWIPAAYVISFDANGGRVEKGQKDILYGSIYGELPVPSIVGGTFIGWFTDKYEGVQVTSQDIFELTENQTLYAHWEYKYTAETPTVSIPTGSEVEEGTRLSLRTETNGALIYYTTDNAIGAKVSPETGILYEDAIELTENVTIYAIAVKSGYNDSEVLTVSYTVRDDSQNWGDITEEDRAELGFVTTGDIPKALWVAGVVDCDYTGKAITYPELHVYNYKTLLQPKVDYTVKYKNNTKAGTATVTITGKGNYAGTITKTFTIRPLDLSNATILDVTVPYNKKVQKVTTTVTYLLNGKEVTLKKGTDFNYSYPGTDKKAEDYDADAFKAAGTYTVYLTGKGNYYTDEENPVTFEVTIVEEPLISKMSLTKIPNQKYTGEEITPSVTLKHGSKKLVEGTDYEIVDYIDNIGVGTATIVIEGRGEYVGTRTATFKITGTSLNKVKMNGYSKSLSWTGDEVKQNVSFTYGENTLIEDIHYTVSYQNNVAVGKATVVYSGIEENGYTGTIKKTFQITGLPINKAVVNGLISTITYDGGDNTQSGYELTYITVVDGEEQSVTLFEDVDGTGTGDYRVSYKNNGKAGKATIIFTGINGYTGTLKMDYKIKAYDISSEDGRISVSGISDQNYLKGGAIPKPVVVYTTTDGEEIVLTEGKDYTLKHTNNKAIANTAAKKAPTVTIIGKGNFTGKTSQKFNIVGSNLSATTMTAGDVVYQKKANICKTAIALYDTNGKKLAAESDYSKTIAYTYAKDVEVTQIVNKQTVYVTRLQGEAVDKRDIIPVGAEITATVTGIKNYAGTESQPSTQSATFRYVAANIAKVKVTVAAQTYTGKAIEPTKDDITVKFGKSSPLEKTDYEIVSYSNNVKKGTAKVTIRGIGNYGGEKTVSFRINSKSMNYTITYDKNATDATGTMKVSSLSAGKKLTANAYKRAGYKFVGWNTKADGSGESYTNKEAFYLKGFMWVYGRSVTLYAQWEVK